MRASNAGRGRLNARDQRLERAPLRRLPASPPSKHRASSSRQRATWAAASPPVGLVHRIVHRAAEVPDGDDRAPLVGGQHQERVVEAGISGQSVLVPRSLGPDPWTRPGCARGSPARPSRVSVGRCAQTSNSAASSLSRILVPPSQVARSSNRRRPSTPSQTGRPRSNNARVRRAASPSAARQAGRHRAAPSRSLSRAPAACQIDAGM